MSTFDTMFKSLKGRKSTEEPKNEPRLDRAQSKTTKQRWRSSVSKGSKASSDIFTKLPIETLMGLPQETLEQLPPETLAQLPPDHLHLLLARLPSEKIALLPPDKLIQLPIDTLVKLPLDTLSKIPPHFFEILSIAARSRLPPEILRRTDVPDDGRHSGAGGTIQPPIAIFTDTVTAQNGQRAPKLGRRPQIPQDDAQHPDEPFWGHSKPRQGPGDRDSTQRPPRRESSQRELRGDGFSGLQHPSAQSITGQDFGQPGQSSHPASPASIASGLFQPAPAGANPPPPYRSFRLDTKRLSDPKSEQSRSPTQYNAGAYLHTGTEALEVTSSEPRTQQYQPWGLQAAKIAMEQGPRAGGVSNSSDERSASVHKTSHSKRTAMGLRAKSGSELDTHQQELTLQRHDTPTSSAPIDHQTTQIQVGQVEELEPKQKEDRQKYAEKLRLADREVEETRKTLQQYQRRVNGLEENLSATHRELDIRTLDLQKKHKELEDKHAALAQMSKDQEVMNKNLDRRDKEINNMLRELDHRNRHLAEFTTREAALKQELATARQASDANTAKHRQEIIDLSQTHQEALEKRTAEHMEQAVILTTNIETSYDQRIKGLVDENGVDMTKMREQLNSQAENIEIQREKVRSLTHIIQEKDADLEETREKYRKTKATYQKKLQDLESESKNELQKMSDHFDAQSQQHQASLTELNTAHETQIQALKMSHQTSLKEHHAATNAKIASVIAERDQFLANHASELYAISQQHSAQLQQERENRMAELHHHQTSYENLLYQERDEHARTLAALRPDPGEHIRQAADHDLRATFRDLRLMVQTVTQPFNLGKLRIPGRVGEGGIDPTGFVEREGKGAVRHLLSSVVWATIVEGFFSSPCGFGAFGKGEGAGLLMDVFRGWVRLVAPAGDSSLAEPDLELFRRDQAANRWRSATFHSIACSIKASGESSSQGDEAQQAQPLVTPFTANQAKVKAEILGILRGATQNPLLEEIEDKVGEITSVAGALALEVGVHRAYLGLAVPQRGELVQIGHEFIDCEDGDAARGTFETVDLVVSPHLYRVGDGRGDLTTAKAIHPGEIYPVRS